MMVLKIQVKQQNKTIYYVNNTICKVTDSLKKAVAFEKDINFNVFDDVIIL